MTVDPEVVGAVAGGALVLALVAGVLALTALSRLRALRRQARARPLDTSDDVVALVGEAADEVVRLRSDLEAVEEQAALLHERAAVGLSRVGTVHYDAFDDMAGRLSFSTAFLDEHGDGVVFTSINGRSETRTYAKPITAGGSRHSLSEEEEAAIARAVARKGRTGGVPDLDEPAAPRTRVRPVAGAT